MIDLDADNTCQDEASQGKKEQGTRFTHNGEDPNKDTRGPIQKVTRDLQVITGNERLEGNDIEEEKPRHR